MIAGVPPDRWRRISSLLDLALDRVPAERAALLDAECGEDSDLKRRVTELLAVAERADGFLEDPALPQARAWLRHAAGEPASRDGRAPARSIGPYRLVQLLSQDGRREVWRALQAEPLRREVALRLIDAGEDAPGIVARFETRRGALAALDHPSLARVLDAGQCAGQVWIAVEYVPGQPITAYCDEHRLRIRERLELFVHVCDAVQHAHEHGVAHGSLCSLDVLVAISGDRPLPKIVDFGTAHDADDPRADVRSLGAILHELLVGSPPSRATVSLRETLRALAAPQAEALAHARRTDPRRLVRRLERDLDWIATTALEPRPGYPSARALSDEIERHLEHEPLLAGPRSVSGRFREWIRRRL